MARIMISGGKPLNGDVWISGAKNAVLGERMGGAVHALSLRTLTPQEAEAS